MDTSAFAELGLDEHILEGVEALGFSKPTPVQAQAIPAVLAGHDVVASAQTGTGKTAAFALPVLQLIEPASRAARERDAVPRQDNTWEPDSSAGGNTPSEGDASCGSGTSAGDVLADAAKPQPSTSIPVTADGKPTAKRRRNHHRKRSGKKKASGSASSAPKELAPDPNAHPFGPFALVITPTRELAQQIDDVVSVVCEHTGQRAVIVMGGATLERQIRQLERGCDLLVATPGRLLDLMEHHHVDLSQVQVLVLDEADRMLDMGFWPSVRRIVAACPTERQTLLFSATIPPSIKGTVDAMLKDPVRIEIARIGETADTVEERLCPVTQGQKTQLLEALIRRDNPERVLVFCRTKHRVDDVEKMLRNAGLSADVMHADRSQKERDRALARFREGKIQVLVATDVMSRGIDVSGIDAVVNFDVPMDPEDYVHRIGRTGRAGHDGLAYTFVAPDEISPLREIEYFTGKRIPTWDLEGFTYDAGRIVPNPDRSTKRPARTMFRGSKARGRGISAGRYGRHY